MTLQFFDKVLGQVGLFLDVGAFLKAAPYVFGNGTASLTFMHTVEPGQQSDHLDCHREGLAIRSESWGDIKRSSTYPITRVIKELPSKGSGFSLGDSVVIEVDGIRPFVIDVGFGSGFQGKTYHTGDNVKIAVTFSAPVIFIGGPPVLVILVGNSRERNITCVAGNGTSTLIFDYQVQLGDTTNILSYKYDEHRALCLSSKCLFECEENQCSDKIVQLSSNSSLRAILRMPLIGGG